VILALLVWLISDSLSMALLFLAMGGSVTVLGGGPSLISRLRAPREVELVDGQLIARWKSRSRSLPLSSVSVRRNPLGSVLDSSIIVADGETKFRVFEDIAGYRELEALLEYGLRPGPGGDTACTYRYPENVFSKYWAATAVVIMFAMWMWLRSGSLSGTLLVLAMVGALSTLVGGPSFISRLRAPRELEVVDGQLVARWKGRSRSLSLASVSVRRNPLGIFLDSSIMVGDGETQFRVFKDLIGYHELEALLERGSGIGGTAGVW
jgi:hypothetical protein